MKKITLITIMMLSFYGFGQQTQKTPVAFGKAISAESISPSGHVRCISTEYEQYLQEQDPKRLTNAQFEAWIAPLIEQYKQLQSVSSQSGDIITIPVVVHVIHSGEPVGTAPNITDAQVESQIEVMNNDFRRLAGTPGFNSNPVGADTQIQFALAKADPNGNPTNGINRVNLCEPSWSTTDINSIVKPATYWNSSQYMNMWSVNFSNSSLLGYAQFPNNSGLGGLAGNNGGASTDGVVANYSTFGSIDYNDGTFLLAAPFNRGRTMTHEVGHFLGLIHIWGNGDCSIDDFCADTPNSDAANYGCPTTHVSCGTVDMVQNYMDYTDDACMNIFTQNQKDRMVVVMNNSPRRNTLKTSTKDLPIELFANDAQIFLEGSCTSAGGSCSGSDQKVTIYNRGTSNLTSATIQYSVAGGTIQTYNWTGNLTTHKFDTFEIPVTSATSGTINVSITAANGGTDQRVSNNSDSGTYEAAVVPTAYTTAQVVLTLQRDYYGTETTWNLTNSAGATIAQGGPYSNSLGVLPALITQTINVPNNDCYVFTINDSAGDGICCGQYGDGYYNLKTAQNVTIVDYTTGAFSSQATPFVIGTLGAEDFALLNSINLYPNPTNGVLNIGISNELELPSSFTVYNTLGQVIEQKKISSNADLTISTESYSNGVYFVKLEKNNESKTLQFIKN